MGHILFPYSMLMALCFFPTIEDTNLKILKGCLVWFEHISGIRINHESGLMIHINFDEEGIHRAAQFFSCPAAVGDFPSNI